MTLSPDESVNIDWISISLVLGTTVFALVLWALLTLYLRRQEAEEEGGGSIGNRKKKTPATSQPNNKKTGKSSGADLTKNKPLERRGVSGVRNVKGPTFQHRWLLTTLKAHSGKVLDLDFAPNKKYLASCADDRTIMLWHTKDFTQKDHKFLRVNVEFDYARKIRWSPDAKAFVICRESGNDLEVYRVNRKPEGVGLSGVQSTMTFSQKHKGDIIGTGIASTGRYVLTCSADTQLVLWSVKGDVLASIETLQVTVYHAAVSPCGRFVATSGFTSDVKVWHVVFDKTGEFKEVARAFELKGHSAGVVSFAFNDDSSRMATVSKDNTWKLWDTNIEFEKGQEPYKLQSTPINVVNGNALIAMSGDGRTVAVASGSYVKLFSASKSYLVDQDGPEVTCLAFDPFGKYFLCGVDKHIRVFHNVIGYQVLIEELEEKRKAAGNSQSLKDRLQTQISEAKAALEAIGEKP